MRALREALAATVGGDGALRHVFLLNNTSYIAAAAQTAPARANNTSYRGGAGGAAGATMQEGLGRPWMDGLLQDIEAHRRGLVATVCRDVSSVMREDEGAGKLSRQSVKDRCAAVGGAFDRIASACAALVVPDSQTRLDVKRGIRAATQPLFDAFNGRHAGVIDTFKHKAKHIKHTPETVLTLISGLFGEFDDLRRH